MRKKYILLFFLFAFNTLMFGQKVTITPTTVNGYSYSYGSINLASVSKSTISLGVKVETPVNAPDNGTVTIYYEKSSGWGANIPSGGNGRFLFFGGGKIGLASFVIYLNSADFNVSGGNLYAEYKTFSGVVYKSNKISIIKDNIPSPPPPSPSPPKQEIVPYGGIPILPEFSDYYDITSKDWVYPTSDVIVDVNSPFYQSQTLRQKTTYTYRIIISENISFFVVNFLAHLKNLRVDNVITGNQYLIDGQIPQTIIGNEASESHSVEVAGSIRNQTVTNSLNNYPFQWQARIKYPLLWSYLSDSYFQLYGWKDIPGATQINYTPPASNNAMEYRRLIIENPLDQSEYRRCATSNVIEIIPLNTDLTKNKICCDQTVNNGDSANPINGDTPNSVYYQWLISEDNTNWIPIGAAENKEYTPYVVQRNLYEPKIQYYKRIIYSFYYNIHYISNVVKITIEPQVFVSTKIYPNPATSILNIENIRASSVISNVIITNSNGSTVIPNSYSPITSSLIQLNVANLQPGIYFLSMVITNAGSSRGFNYETTFIKQ